MKTKARLTVEQENRLLQKLLPARSFKKLIRCAKFDDQTPMEFIKTALRELDLCTPDLEHRPRSKDERENNDYLCSTKMSESEVRYCNLEGISPADWIKTKLNQNEKA